LEVLITIKNYALVLFGLGVAIFVHEFGHFILAKLCGVKVEKFSIGFGKPIWKWVRGETEYILAMVPLGGYVQMLGQSDFGSDDKTDDPTSYANKTPSQRALIIIAGVTMNAILAVVLFSFVFTVGKRAISPEIGAVSPGSPAALAGLKHGDVVVGVNGYDFIDFEDVKIHVVLAGTKNKVNLRVKNEEGIRDVALTPVQESGQPLPTVGIVPAIALKVWQVEKEAKKRNVGIKRGDIITAINGEPVDDWSLLVKEMAEGKARKVTFTVRRDGESVDVEYQPQKIENWRLGIKSAGPVTLTTVSEGMGAYKGGLREDDAIITIDGEKISCFMELQEAISGAGGKPMTIKYLRDAKEAEATVTAAYVPYYDPRDIRPYRWRIGVAPEFSFDVGEVTPGSGAEKAGIKPTAKILSLGYYSGDSKNPKKSWSANELGSMARLQAFVRAARTEDPDARFKVEWEFEGKAGSAFVEPDIVGDPVGRFEFVTNNKMITLQTDPVKAMGYGLRKTWFFLRMSCKTITMLVSRKMKVESGAVSGPIGIFYYGSKIGNEGLLNLVYFFAIINISLAFFNLLPIAPLDGGHLVFLGIEKVRGKPVSEKIIYAVFIAGWVLLLSFVLYVTVFDIRKFLPF